MRHKLLIISSLLTVISINALIAAPAPEASLQWAERILQRASQPPVGTTQQLGLPGQDARTAQGAFQTLVTRYDPTSRAWVGLARSYALLGKYDDSIQAFQQALNLAPKDSAIQLDLQHAEVYAKVAHAAARNLPKEQTVIRVLPYPSKSGTSYWTILSANVNNQVKDRPVYTDVYLTTFSGSPSNFSQVWQATNVGQDSYVQGEFNDIQAYAIDVNGDGKLDLVVPEVLIGADWIPSYLSIYSWRDDQIVKLLGVKSQLQPAIVDLNGDGRYEVMTYYVIGKQMSHAEQPYWSDIYTYKNGNYQISDAQFPAQYNKVCSQINQTLKRYPTDPELKHYQSKCRQILKR